MTEARRRAGFCRVYVFVVTYRYTAQNRVKIPEQETTPFNYETPFQI